MAETEPKERYLYLSLPDCKYQERVLGDFINFEDASPEFLNCRIHLARVALPEGLAYMCIVDAGFRGKNLEDVMYLSAPVGKINGSDGKIHLKPTIDAQKNPLLESFTRLSLLAMRDLDIQDYTKNIETRFVSLEKAKQIFYREAYSVRLGFQTQILRSILENNPDFRPTARDLMLELGEKNKKLQVLKVEQLRRRFIKYFRRKNDHERKTIMERFLESLDNSDPQIVKRLILANISAKRGVILNPDAANPFICYKPRNRSDFEKITWAGASTVKVQFGENVEVDFELGIDEEGNVTRTIKNSEVANFVIPAIAWVKKDGQDNVYISRISDIPPFKQIALAYLNGGLTKNENSQKIKQLDPLMFLLITVMLNPELKDKLPKWHKAKRQFVDCKHIPEVALEYNDLILNSELFKKFESAFL